MKTKLELKNPIGFLLVGLTLMVLSSCTSSSDQVFTDPNAPSADSATIQSLVTGIEAGSRTELGIYIRAVASFAREAYYFEPSDPRYTGELLFGPIDPGGFLLTRPWGARYRVVKNCNILLERAPSVSPAEARSSVEGFANTMLAHELLMNLNYTDTNGIRVDVGGATLGPFVTKSDALVQIASMLDSGLSSLNAGGSSFPFSLSSGFAGYDSPAGFAQFNRALRARVAAYMSDWNGVLAALSGSFLNASGSLEDGVYHVYSTGSGDELNPIFEPPQADSIKLHGHPTFETDAEAGDNRYSSKVEKRNTTTFDSLVSDLAVTVSASSVDHFPMIRNEELLLLRAEANIQLGDLAAAESDINIIRAAAGLSSVVLSSVDSAIDQMLHERRYSLFMEGHRWIDLRRYGRLGSLPIDRAGDTVIERMPIPADENQ